MSYNIENQEIIDHLLEQGLGDLLAALETPEVYTRKGRVKKAALARTMGLKTNQVVKLLARMRSEAESVSR